MHLLALLLLNFHPSHAYRILAVAPAEAYSHHKVFKSVWKALADAGHQVVTVTPYPIGDKSIANLEEIKLEPVGDYKPMELTRLAGEWEDVNQARVTSVAYEYNSIVAAAALQNQQLQGLLQNATEQFDLVIFEYIGLQLAALGPRFNCPYIAISSLDVPFDGHERLGIPLHPAVYSTNMYSYYTVKSFAERLYNVLMATVMKHVVYPVLLRRDGWVVRKHFGDEYPSLRELLEGMSLFLAYTNPAFQQNRPLLPTVVTFSYGSLVEAAKPLPKDIETFLEANKNGTIYFSIGTMLEFSYLPAERQAAILGALEDLPFNVIVKVREDAGFEDTDKIKFLSWVPQADLLRHKNVKLFINHAGLHSVEEGMYAGVPMISMPFFGDQQYNADMVQTLGMGVKLRTYQFTKEDLKRSILKVVFNSTYKENLVRLSKIADDQPMGGLEKVVWWCEYVVRHKGAKHLRSPFLDLPLYQYYHLDIIGVLLTAALLIYYVLYLCVSRLRNFLFYAVRRKVKLH